SVLDGRAGKLLEQKLRLFLPLPLVPQQKHERKVSNAPHRGCSAHRDGLSCLSLPSDYYAATSGVYLGLNATFTFSHWQYWTGRDFREPLLSWCARAGLLAPIHSITKREQESRCLSHL